MATIFRNPTNVSYRKWWGAQYLGKRKYKVEHFLNVCSRNLQILCHHMNSKGQKHLAPSCPLKGWGEWRLSNPGELESKKGMWLEKN